MTNIRLPDICPIVQQLFCCLNTLHVHLMVSATPYTPITNNVTLTADSIHKSPRNIEDQIGRNCHHNIHLCQQQAYVQSACDVQDLIPGSTSADSSIHTIIAQVAFEMERFFGCCCIPHQRLFLCLFGQEQVGQWRSCTLC